MSLRFLALAALFAPVTLAAQLPADPPALLTDVRAAPLASTELVLPNGLRVILVEQHRQPVVSLTLAIPAGSAFDLPGKEGTADLLTRLLPRGYAGRTSVEIATTVENLGGSLGVADDPDGLTLQVDLTSDHLETALTMLGGLVTAPTLDSLQLEGYRQEALARIAAEQESPAALANRVLLIGVYRRHPYGRRPTPQSVRTITRADVQAFYRARVRPAGATLVVAGDFAPAAARQLIARTLGTWKGVRPAPLASPPLGPTPTTIYLLHQGGARNASVVLGGTTFSGTDTSYASAAVLNQILGETGGSRLSQVLANQYGWTDVVQSVFVRTVHLGLFQITAETPSGVIDSTVQAIQAQLERLRTDLVPARELDLAREAAKGAAAMRVQTVSQLSATLAQQRLVGLPLAYYSSSHAALDKVTAASVRALARRVFDPKALVLVVSGDAGRLYQPLSALGPVKIFGADGSTLQPDDVMPKMAPFRFDSSAITSRIDSLGILAQGKVVGIQVGQTTVAGDSILYSERTSLGPQFNQTTTVVLDRRGRMRHVEQTGTVRGQATRIDLRYAGGRVQGRANVIGPEGPRTLNVDAPVDAATLDDNALQAMLPWLDWALNRRWTFRVFASGENLVRTQTLTVANIEQVRTPSGVVEAFRADLDGGPQRVSFYVSTALPHRLVRMTVEGSPLEFLLINR